MEDKLINLAKVIAIDTNNFIHGIDHIVRVNDLSIYIANNINKKLLNKECKALKLAAYWHDIGRVDNQKYMKKYDHADNSAESLYVFAKRYDLEENEIVKLAISAIKNHRSKNGSINEELTIDRILWDADKLDILNVNRVLRIVSDYKNYGTYGDYDLEGSLFFWDSIKENFIDKFHFEISKQLFKENYPKFRTTIDKIKTDEKNGK